MSAMGLGRVKTPTPAARVENLGAIAHHESQIILRTNGSISRKRIIFFTFFRCMSFHTAWVISDGFAKSMPRLFFVQQRSIVAVMRQRSHNGEYETWAVPQSQTTIIEPVMSARCQGVRP